ncbi:MAG: hypothetical protein VYE46_08105 [Cyanobacteriota bacterium]|nr:hypothetical protein [Cyanobacteriota bacterium]
MCVAATRVRRAGMNCGTKCLGLWLRLSDPARPIQLDVIRIQAQAKDFVPKPQEIKADFFLKRFTYTDEIFLARGVTQASKSIRKLSWTGP